MELKELLEIVDENNVLTGQLVTRKEAYEKGLLHRAAHAIIFDEEGKALLQQRSAAKKICPLKWDMSVGEHVKPGESYVRAVIRGAREELGLYIVPKLVYPVHPHRVEDGGRKDYELVETYAAVTNQSPRIDTAEVAAAGFYLQARIAQLDAIGQLTPWFSVEWQWILKNPVALRSLGVHLDL